MLWFKKKLPDHFKFILLGNKYSSKEGRPYYALIWDKGVNIVHKVDGNSEQVAHARRKVNFLEKGRFVTALDIIKWLKQIK